MNENRQILLDYVLKHGGEMFHEAKGLLKYPYLDPAGPYTESLWDWDSFWASKALLQIGLEIMPRDQGNFYQQVKKYAKGSLLNFLEVQGEDGSLPILMSSTDADLFDCLNNAQNNMSKPFQAQFLALLLEHGIVDEAEAGSILPKLQKVAICRNLRYRNEATGLLVWANDIAIGVDDDPAVWGRPDFSTAHIYYNAVLAAELFAAQELARKLDNNELCQFFSAEYQIICDGLQKYAWDERDNWFYSLDIQCRQNIVEHRYFGKLNINAEPFWKVLPIRIRTWSGVIPLWSKVATPDQAAKVVANLLDEHLFWSKYGIRSLAANERCYAPGICRGNPSNWLGPVWIISCYMAWKGLKNYGFNREAQVLSNQVIDLLSKDYQKNGILHEYYHPETGKGICGPGFLSWNLLALCMEDSES